MYSSQAIATFATAILLFPVAAFGQSSQDYQLLKSEKSESFYVPFTAANRVAENPFVYVYEEPKSPSWILTIRNNISYVPSEDAKTVIKIQEPAPSEKYIEIAMYGGESRKYSVAVNLPEVGYGQLYSNEKNGWSTDNPIAVAHGETVGLTVSDGKRTVVDRFDLDGFAVGSISVYGKDEPNSGANAVGGEITFDILFGSFADSPIFFVPAAVTAGIGGTVIALLILKKRKSSV